MLIARRRCRPDLEIRALKGMRDKKTIWVRYTWDLPNPSLDLQKPPDYLFRSVQPTELNAATATVFAAYTSDAVWEHQIDRIRERMAERITSTLGRAESEYIAAEFGGNLVAISGVAKSHWTDQNLLTGVCVVPEHQRRGLGNYLLGLSLSWLSERGCCRREFTPKQGQLRIAEFIRCLGR